MQGLRAHGTLATSASRNFLLWMVAQQGQGVRSAETTG
jgi:hypothetical protein